MSQRRANEEERRGWHYQNAAMRKAVSQQRLLRPQKDRGTFQGEKIEVGGSGSSLLRVLGEPELGIEAGSLAGGGWDSYGGSKALDSGREKKGPVPHTGSCFVA